jgi:hypothetical protein
MLFKASTKINGWAQPNFYDQPDDTCPVKLHRLPAFDHELAKGIFYLD